MNALVYVVGYAVTKLKHRRCRKRMVLKHGVLQILQNRYSFCRLKHHLHANGFKYPNNAAIEIGTLLLIAFKEKFYNFFTESRSGVKNRLTEYVDYCDYESYICPTCFERFTDCLINTLIKGQLLKIKNKINKKNRNTSLKKNGKARRMGIESKQQVNKTGKMEKYRRTNYKIKRTRLNQESDSVQPIQNTEKNDVVIPSSTKELIGGPSSSCENAPKLVEKDYEQIEMEKCVTMLENFVAKFPPRNTIRVEQRDCLHLSLEYILSTFTDFENELRHIFIKYKKYGRYLSKIMELTSWNELSNILDENHKLRMIIYLEQKLLPEQEFGMVG
ncbi:uncharacterized protein LOC131432658 [Malaya genurostris]|uniref:uncharacterized protein LOC131432658 n=1 Tax=Malaya genurostris TaxID=325434 RepID=UPI0026F3CDEA|nr:uncharacterized protein LOC131432658 [Malaya genurostris]